MAIEFFATNNFTGNGMQTQWNINFSDGYLSPDNVKARYVNAAGSFVDIAVTAVNGNVVTISPAQPSGRVFSIYRSTQKTQPLVNFADGAILNEQNLDILGTQAIMVAAEASDLANSLSGYALTASANANTALSTSATALAAAQSAAGVANTANNTANAASAAAANAVVTANAIDGKASTALTNASAALSTANAASATANAIDGKATNALSQASSAVTTANAASSNANTALSTANAIDGKAQSALDASASASSDASNAVSTANAASAAVSGKAAKGANSDITSLTGLTTPLSAAQGGTGRTDNKAAGLVSSRTFRTDLGSTSAAAFDGSSNVTPGVTGTLPVANGGTGATTAAAARTNLGAAQSGINADITQLSNNVVFSNGLTTLANTIASSLSTTGNITASGTVTSKGVSNASDAAAGNVGEYKEAVSPNTTMAGGVLYALTSLTLTPGEWELRGAFGAEGVTGNLLAMQVGLSTSNSVLPTFPYTMRQSTTVDFSRMSAFPLRVNISTNTTYYLLAQLTLNTGSGTGYGFLAARRVR